MVRSAWDGSERESRLVECARRSGPTVLANWTWLAEETQRDDGGAKLQEGQMDVGPVLVADLRAPEAVEPGDAYFCRFCNAHCQDENSSTVRSYRLQASSRLSNPPWTAKTTSAFRRLTQRRVLRGGRSAIVRILPFGPTMYGKRALALFSRKRIYRLGV